uniref:Centrosomal protein 20 n=1 Tax=Sus scrofa TaxID=9823 RepID=A0A8D1VJ35_PIG
MRLVVAHVMIIQCVTMCRQSGCYAIYLLNIFLQSMPKNDKIFSTIEAVNVLYLTVLKDTLEKRGVLGHLKARIRAEVFNALDDESEPRPSLSHENLLINELIREYLEFNKYKYTASVLIAESGQPVVPLDRQFLIRELNAFEESKDNTIGAPALPTEGAEEEPQCRRCAPSCSQEMTCPSGASFIFNLYVLNNLFILPVSPEFITSLCTL